MRLSTVLLLISVAGCATAQLSQEQRALNACFFEDEQRGWHLDTSPPQNAQELRQFIAKEVKNDVVLEGRYQYWFRHDDGRKFVCSLLNVGELPSICGRIAYELVPKDSTWQVKQSDLIMCHERKR